MKRLQSISWPEIFEYWRVSESSNPLWIRTATTVKGWPDWESWRMFTATQLGLPERKWSLYEITDPINQIPTMLIGPFSGWQSRLPKPNVSTFTDLINIPKQYEHFSSIDGIRRMMSYFPAGMLMTGLKKTDGRVVLIEGHHRATAVALAQHNGLITAFSEPVLIALAELTAADDTLLDRVLARGTTKIPPVSA
jgi:hypothetical protein